MEKRGSELPRRHREWLARYVKQHGLAAAVAAIGTSRAATERALAGLPVLAGTRALVSQRYDVEQGGEAPQ